MFRIQILQPLFVISINMEAWLVNDRIRCLCQSCAAVNSKNTLFCPESFENLITWNGFFNVLVENWLFFKRRLMTMDDTGWYVEFKAPFCGFIALKLARLLIFHFFKDIFHLSCTFQHRKRVRAKHSRFRVAGWVIWKQMFFVDQLHFVAEHHEVVIAQVWNAKLYLLRCWP